MPPSHINDNRRKYYRNSTQKVVLIIDNEPYLVKDWSPDGFSIFYDAKKFNSGDEVQGQIDVYDLEDMGEFTGTVVRHDDQNVLAVRFTNLSSHVFVNFCVNLVNTDAEIDN
ncbi:PilZ domain-containing protein [Sneathiella glossodoripedis]|uniref:PilZ domain-containing protein n=1 Tax=Sneathiella glossodoripedis TaxID=418853 RepID=UPI000471F692|nr:PilZ domain-containing protein [Sneathiella glossodoripedis]